MVDVLQVKPEVVDNSEHEAEMVAKYEGTEPEATEATDTDRPEWLPEKFKTPEELAKSYSELEALLGKTPEPEAKADEPEAKANEPEEETKDKPEVKTEGVTTESLEAFYTEYADKGELSPESYQKLAEENGLPKEVVDAYIKGQEASTALQLQNIYKTVGGEEEYNSMTRWASANLTEQEILDFNEAATQEGGDTISAVKELHKRFTEASGVKPQLVQGEATGRTEAVYDSWEQVKVDMQTKAYKTDPAFRAKVSQKLAASNI